MKSGKSKVKLGGIIIQNLKLIENNILLNVKWQIQLTRIRNDKKDDLLIFVK